MMNKQGLHYQYGKYHILRYDDLNIVVATQKDTSKLRRDGYVRFKDEWKVLSYHGTLESALRRLIDKVSSEDYLSLKECVIAIKELKLWLKEQFSI